MKPHLLLITMVGNYSQEVDSPKVPNRDILSPRLKRCPFHGHHAHIFEKGLLWLIIPTDHKPFLEMLNSKPLEAVRDPRFVRLKKRLLRIAFSIKYTLEKWNHATDALSRYLDSKSSQTKLM